MDARRLLRAVLWVAGVVAALTLIPDLRDGLGQLQADHLVERASVKAQRGDWAVAETFRSGYMPTAYVIQVAEQAGFKLAGQSEINANPKDTKDYPKGMWTLPPT